MESPGQMHWAGTAEEGKNVPGYYGNAFISSALLHTCKGCFFQPSQPCFSILISPGLKPGEGALESSLELLWNKADYKLFLISDPPAEPRVPEGSGRELREPLPLSLGASLSPVTGSAVTVSCSSAPARVLRPGEEGEE